LPTILSERSGKPASRGEPSVARWFPGVPDPVGALNAIVMPTKPIATPNLQDVPVEALGQRAPHPAPPAPAETALPLLAAPRRARVLLAEDNAVNQRVALGLLNSRGHEVRIAATGREAVAAVEREPFDLVLMDLQMPEMDGIEATVAIRARERTSGGHVRIVAMTARTLAGDRERCLAAGMDGYLAKPIDRARLLAVVEDGSAGDPAGAAPPAAAAFDRALLLARLGGDEALLALVVQLFLEDCPGRLAAIRQAVDARDAEALEASAHALKGAAANLSASRLMAAAAALEGAAREQQLECADAGWRLVVNEASALMDALGHTHALAAGEVPSCAP